MLSTRNKNLVLFVLLLIQFCWPIFAPAQLVSAPEVFEEPRQITSERFTVESLPSPKKQGQDYYVTNPNAILSSETVFKLDRMSKLIDSLTGAEFAIAAVNDYEGDSDFQFALDLFNKWGIGKKDADNGLLLFLAIDRREYRFIAGYGMESVMPDAYLKRIGEKYLVPKFQVGDYDQGVLDAATFISEVLMSPDIRAELEARLPEATPFWSFRNVYFKNSLLVLGMFAFFYLVVHFVSSSLIKKPNKKYPYVPIIAGLGCMGLLMFLTVFLFAFLLQNLEFIYQKKHLPYFVFVLGGIILAIKITYTRKSISKSYTDTGERAKAINKFLVFTFIPMLLSPLAWFDLIGIISRKAKDRNRFVPPDNSGDWQRVNRDQSEKEIKTYLSKGNLKEESIKSRSYEIWENLQTKKIMLIPWDIKSSFKECPHCHFFTLRKGKRHTIIAATYSKTGKGEKVDDCENCSYRVVIDTYTIPKKVRSSSSSSGGSSSSGSSGGGSSSSGSFGGGSSGGGGAGGRW